MSRKHVKTKQFLNDQSLEADFQTEWTDIAQLDNTGILITTDGVSANEGTFDVQVRMKASVENEVYSDPVPLTLDAVPTLADADAQFFINLNQVPANQVRLSFNASGVYEVQTVTLPALAGATDGDYVVITDTNTDEWAIALDTTGAASNEPSGAAWVAIGAGNKDYVDISGAVSAADVAALVKTALEALVGFTDVFTIVNQGSGVLRLTSVVSGPLTNPTPHDKTDGGAGSIAGAQVTAGVLADGTCDVWFHTKSIGA